MHKRDINILVITTWFPNIYEKTKCVFTKNIINAQSENLSYLFTVIIPRPYFPNLNFKWIPKKLKNYYNLQAYEKNREYEIYRPFYLKIPFLGKSFLWRFYYYAVSFLILKKQNVNFDIIHSHGVFPDAYVAIKIGKKFNVPVACHFHDSYFNRINEKYPKYVKEIIEQASKIIVVSEFQKQTILNAYPNANNLIKIYNGIDGRKFIGLSTGIKKDKFVFIGNLIDVKGLDILIKSMSELADIKIELDVYGKGNNISLYKKMIEEYELSDRIQFKGTVDNEQIPNVLQNYAGLILPSRYETFGIVLIEAMSSGLFVIASDVGAIPEIVISEEYGLLFESGSVESLKLAIVKSLNIHWNRQNISEYGKSFDISSTSDKINKLYENLLLKDLDKNEV